MQGRLWLALCVAVTLVLIVQGQRPGGSGGKEGKTRDDVCDLNKIKDDLSEEEIALIQKVQKENGTFSSLLSFICDIPGPCLRNLSLTTTDLLVGQEAVIKAKICECKDIEVIKAILDHVAQEDICTSVIVPVLDYTIEPNMCKLEKGELNWLVKGGSRENCSIPSKYLILWPGDHLKTKLDTMSDDDFIAMLNHLAMDPEFVWKHGNCAAIGHLGDSLVARNLLPFDDLAALMANLAKLRNLENLLPFLPVSICQNLNPTTLGYIDGWKLVEPWCGDRGKSGGMTGGGMGGGKAKGGKGPKDKNTNKCSFHCADAIIDNFLKEGDIAYDQLEDKLGNLAKCVSPKKKLTTITKGKCKDVEVPELDTRLKHQVAKKCDPGPASALTVESLTALGCVASEVYKMKELKAIDKTTLCETHSLGSCLGLLSKLFSRECAVGELTETAVENLGAAAVELKCSTIQETSKNQNSKNALKNSLMRHGVGKGNEACYKDLVDELPIEDKVKNRRMMDMMDTKTFNSEIANVVNDIVTKLKESGIDVDRPKAHIIVKNYLGGRKVAELNDEDFEKMEELVKGLTLLQIRSFKKAVRRFSLCEADGWNNKQLEEIKMLIEDSKAEFNKEEPFSEISLEEAEDMSDSCLIGLAPYIKNMTTEVGEYMCQRIGASDALHCGVRLHKRRMIARDCLMICQGEKTAPDGDVANCMGSQIMYLSKENIATFKGLDLGKACHMFSRPNCMVKDVIDAITDKISGAFSATGDQPGGMCGVMTGATAEKLVEDGENVEMSLPEQIRKSLEQEPCCMSDRKEKKDRDAIKELRRKISKKSQEIVVTPEGTTNQRRRRATPNTLTYLVLKDYPLNLLTTDEIGQIEDFSDLVDVLGNTEYWTDGQKTALCAKYKSEMNIQTYCGLTSDQLYDMGTIAYCMTKDEIKCLENLDIDAVRGLGPKRDWSQEQLTALMEQYLARSNGVSAASLNATYLSVTGHLICGMSTTDIEKIDNNVLKQSIKLLANDVKKCNTDVLTAIFNKLVHADIYGPLDKWSATEHEDVGIFFAGLPADDIKDIADLSYVTDEAWEHMTAEHFKKITNTQLEGLTDSQRDSIDEDKLSQDQRDLINSDTDGGDTTGGAPVTMMYSATCILVTVLVTLAL